MRGPAKLVLGLLGLGAIACFLFLYRGKMGLWGSGGFRTTGPKSQTSSSAAPAQIDWQEVDRSPDGFKIPRCQPAQTKR